MPKWSSKEPEEEKLLTTAEVDRFWAKVAVDEVSDCWVWVGAVASGYGRVNVRGKIQGAHRVSYSTWVGAIPARMDLDHVQCQRPRCVNPRHIEPVTHRENCLRGKSPPADNARRSGCVNGHAWGEPGAVWIRANGARHCRQCARERQRLLAPDGRTRQAVYTARWRAKASSALASPSD